MDEYLIAFGSNLGPREQNIREACSEIEVQIGRILKISNFYETAPIGNADQSFLNGALICQSGLSSPFAVLKTLLAIEKSLGRTRECYWGNRTIDLDIILWKRENFEFPSLDHAELSIPHPRCLERDFVLVPACEIAGDWQYPQSGQELMTYLPQIKIHSIKRKWES